MRQLKHSSQLNCLTSWVKAKTTFLYDDDGEDDCIKVPPHGFEEFLEFYKKLSTSEAMKKLLKMRWKKYDGTSLGDATRHILKDQ